MVEGSKVEKLIGVVISSSSKSGDVMQELEYFSKIKNK